MAGVSNLCRPPVRGNSAERNREQRRNNDSHRHPRALLTAVRKLYCGGAPCAASKDEILPGFTEPRAVCQRMRFVHLQQTDVKRIQWVWGRARKTRARRFSRWAARSFRAAAEVVAATRCAASRFGQRLSGVRRTRYAVSGSEADYVCGSHAPINRSLVLHAKGSIIGQSQSQRSFSGRNGSPS